jgi:hypothetical protein
VPCVQAIIISRLTPLKLLSKEHKYETPVFITFCNSAQFISVVPLYAKLKATVPVYATLTFALDRLSVQLHALSAVIQGNNSLAVTEQ